MDLMPLNCTFKNVKFVMYVLLQKTPNQNHATDQGTAAWGVSGAADGKGWAASGLSPAFSSMAVIPRYLHFCLKRSSVAVDQVQRVEG